MMDTYPHGQRVQDVEERFTVTRNELIAGIIVGVGGTTDTCVTQEQAERAADLIIRRSLRRRPTTEGTSHE